MKGKKLGKQSQHVRVLSTKKGKKRVLVNPGRRKKVVWKKMRDKKNKIGVPIMSSSEFLSAVNMGEALVQSKIKNIEDI